MARIVWAPGIERVSGALSKPKERSDGNTEGMYVIGKSRRAPTTNPYTNTIFLISKETYVRTTEPTTKELWARTRFATISKQLAAIRRNPTSKAQSELQFELQKDAPGGYPTYLKFMWARLGAAYDQENPKGGGKA